jgi:hypothetical protein
MSKKRYRPANGSEGEWFKAQYCHRCTRDNFYPTEDPKKGCKILLKTLIYDKDDEEYPEEWIYDENGKPTCTAFHSDGTLSPEERREKLKEETDFAKRGWQ